jgi:DNA-directed RNA polymerase II subunit RPB11
MPYFDGILERTVQDCGRSTKATGSRQLNSRLTTIHLDSSSSYLTKVSRRLSTRRRPVSSLAFISRIPLIEHAGVPNTAIFTFNKEDHTLGNLLSQRLLKYDYIVFSAYKVPHPLFATFELRVQTDGTVTPKEAIIRCCKDIVQDLHVLNSSFQTEWLGKKIVSEGEADRIARERDAF